MDAPESIFYAALELRSGIEARLAQYLAAHEFVEAAKRDHWNLEVLADTVAGTFKIGDQTAVVEVMDATGSLVLARLCYTPVRRAKQHHRNLNGLLHRRKRFRKPADRWWQEHRYYLQGVERDLAFALTGSLLGPLLMETGTRNVYLRAEIIDPEAVNLQALKAAVGSHTVLRVSYRADLADTH